MRMKLKKILICGDSFAANTLSTDDSWTHLMKSDFEITNKASPGVGEYKILQQVKSEKISKYDYIIISHTSPNRIHTLENPLYDEETHTYHSSDVLFNDCRNKLGKHPDADFLYNYFLKIFDLDYYEYIHMCCCRDIDELTKGHKTIHVTHFDWDGFYDFGKRFYNFYPIWEKNKGNINHYSALGNRKIYEKIHTMINDVTIQT